jgi:hypothetical protein
MRKSAGLIALFAALALLAVPSFASAKSTSVLPSLKRANYSKVSCTVVSTSKACSKTPFKSVSAASILKENGETLATCEVTLEGHIEANGTTEVTAGSVKGAFPCEFITLNFAKKWPDEICEYKVPTEKIKHQMWDRLEVHFAVTILGKEYNGPVFIHLKTAAGADGDPLVIGEGLAPTSEIDESGATITADGTGVSKPYIFTVSEAFPQVRVESLTPECAWPKTEGLE